jgi:hypothetical protein
LGHRNYARVYLYNRFLLCHWFIKTTTAAAAIIIYRDPLVIAGMMHEVEFFGVIHRGKI